MVREKTPYSATLIRVYSPTVGQVPSGAVQDQVARDNRMLTGMKELPSAVSGLMKALGL